MITIHSWRCLREETASIAEEVRAAIDPEAVGGAEAAVNALESRQSISGAWNQNQSQEELLDKEALKGQDQLA